MNRSICMLLALPLFACGAGEPGTATGPVGAGAPVTSSYAGTYSVPVPAELAAAATYDVPEMTWTVNGSTATLAYALPKALVGTTIRVTFSGPFDAATGKATLSGAAGTAECVVAATTIKCNETMHGLLPIAVDLGVVAKLAPAGLAAARVEVAKRFSTDPIGIADVDRTRVGTPEVPEPVHP